MDSVSDILWPGTTLSNRHTLQELWSGYGGIDRYGTNRPGHTTVIVKHIVPPDVVDHPRGWATDVSHQRKLRSYQVERNWYRRFAAACDGNCRVPQLLHASKPEAEEQYLVLEDLDVAGYAERREEATLPELYACIRWLAWFHARFLGVEPAGLWQTGTYWHLETRPDELAALSDSKLRQAAPVIDQALRAVPYRTLVHGDAKLANFCFAVHGLGVAAVDFQYVGGGCGMQDLAYLVSSALDADACQQYESAILAHYFAELAAALLAYKVPVSAAQIEAAWRPAYRLAWADLYRFLAGWSPGHWKMHSYSGRLTNQVLDEIADSGPDI